MRKAAWSLVAGTLVTQTLLLACADEARHESAGDDARAGEVDVSTGAAERAPRSSLIPHGEPAYFNDRERSDLSLSASGGIALVEALYFPVDSLTPGAWLTIGVEGRSHPVLSGRFRFQRYRDLLVDLFTQSHAPTWVGARARLDECTKDLADTLSTHGLADHWERLAAGWEGAYAESFVPTLRALRSGPRVPLERSVENDAVRALAAEAICYADVIDRMRVFRIFSRASGLAADPAFARALTRAEERIKKRRALTVVATAELVRVRTGENTGTTLVRTRLPFVPSRAVPRLFPGIADSLVGRIGFDRRWRPGPVTTMGSLLDVDATLVLYATLEYSLFTHVTPEDGCGESSGHPADRDVVVALGLRRYLGFRYARIVADLLRSTPALAVNAWAEHAPDLGDVDVATALASARALGERLDDEMAACDR